MSAMRDQVETIEMSLRFQKRIRVLPFVWLNFGKTGFTSITIGGRFVSLNVGKRGVYLNGSLVGTGLRYRKRIDKTGIGKDTREDNKQDI